SPPHLFGVEVPVRVEVRPRVLLIHDQVEQREAWSAVLRDCDVLEAASANELRDRSCSQIEVVVCHFTEELADRVRASCPSARFIHFDEALPAAVLEGVSQGHEVCWVDRASDLADKVARLSRPVRTAQRVAIDAFDVVWAGTTGSFSLID